MDEVALLGKSVRRLGLPMALEDRPFLPFLRWGIGLGLLLALATPPLRALDAERELSQYRYSSWNNQNGLPQSGILGLAHSPRSGYLWIGTERGLVRFDGTRFAPIPLSAEGLAERRITALAVAKDEKVWVGTNQGLFELSSGQSRLVPPSQTPCAAHVTLLQQAASGELLTGTEDGLLCRLGPSGWEKIGPAGNQRPVESALVTARGDYWLGTATGSLWRRASGSKSWERLTDTHVFALAERQDGSVIAGTAEGLLRWQQGRLEPWNPMREKRPKAVRALQEDRDGNLWVAFRPDGLARIAANGSVAHLSHGPLAENPIANLLEDREGNLWVGTNADGLFLLEGTPFIPFGEPEGLDRQIVWSVLADRSGSVWMSTRKGVRRLDSAGRRAPVPAGLDDQHAGALLETRNGDLWVGLAAGVARVSQGRAQKWMLESGPAARMVTALAERAEGGLWVGVAGKGLYHFANGHFTREAGFPAATIHGLLVTTKGEVWAATRRGAYVRRAGHWSKSSAGTAAVFSIAERPDGSLWMATEAEGLLRLKNGIVSRASAAQGLCANTNYSLLDDGQGHFWLGSPIGVTALSIAELEAVADGKSPRLSCRSYGMADGTRSAECSGGMSPASSKGRDGRLWFATRGVVAVSGSLQAAPAVFPTPLLESAEYLPGRLVTERLPVGQRDVSIRFAAPYFGRNRQWPLEYRLAGYDQAWQNGATRLARYTNLPPGSYRFEVRMGETGGPSGDPVSLVAFAVPPYFVETPACWILIICTMLAGGFLLVRARLRTIERRREELERLVVERTREAQQAAKAKGEFLANMSHEIRTPMNGTLGAAELLAQMQLSPEARDQVEMIRTSGEALLVLINDILDYSKIEAGKLQLESQPFSLLSCVDDALALVTINAHKKGLDLGDHIDTSVPDRITGDAVRLRQMLLNLLSNAVKFTPAGKVWLRIEREAIAGPAAGEQLHFTVSDTGIGISAEGQSRLFQDFSQADASTTRRFGGTGLGLAITKRLCQAMGGRIWVESREGAGSHFHFTIPLAAAPERELSAPKHGETAVLAFSRPDWQDSAEQRLRRLGYACQVAPLDDEGGFTIPPQTAVLVVDSPSLAAHPEVLRYRNSHPPGRVLVVGTPGHSTDTMPGSLVFPIRQTSLSRLLGVDGARESQPESNSPTRPGDLAPLRILLADDSVINQRVISGMLRRLGYDVDVVDNGVRVLKALDRQPYDVVLLDVQMPEMDGIEAARRIVQKWPPGGRPILIAVTAGAFEEDRDKCLAAGMDLYLTKPLRIADLQAALAKVPSAGAGATPEAADHLADVAS